MRPVTDLAIRVFAAIALLVIPVNVFYFLFSKATLWGSLLFLHVLGYTFQVDGYTLFVNDMSLEFVPACVATSAYYLLALLVLLTKDVRLKVRFYLFFLGAFLIFLANSARVDILLYILVRFGENWFDRIHIFFWHFVSSVYVAVVWIFLVYKLKVKAVPVYSDFRFLLSQSVFARKGKSTSRSKHRRLGAR